MNEIISSMSHQKISIVSVYKINKFVDVVTRTKTTEDIKVQHYDVRSYRPKVYYMKYLCDESM